MEQEMGFSGETTDTNWMHDVHKKNLKELKNYMYLPTALTGNWKKKKKTTSISFCCIQIILKDVRLTIKRQREPLFNVPSNPNIKY